MWIVGLGNPNFQMPMRHLAMRELRTAECRLLPQLRRLVGIVGGGGAEPRGGDGQGDNRPRGGGGLPPTAIEEDPHQRDDEKGKREPQHDPPPPHPRPAPRLVRPACRPDTAAPGSLVRSSRPLLG